MVLGDHSEAIVVKGGLHVSTCGVRRVCAVPLIVLGVNVSHDNYWTIVNEGVKRTE